MPRQVAARRGLLLTFVGKPINGRGGSGVHANLSLSGKGVDIPHTTDWELSEYLPFL